MHKEVVKDAYISCERVVVPFCGLAGFIVALVGGFLFVVGLSCWPVLIMFNS